MRLHRLPDGDQWDPRQPWAHGDKRGDLNQRGRWVVTVGRWQFGVARCYTGDRYGSIGADSWQVYFTVAKDPK